MRVIRDYKYCPEIAKHSLLVIGNFDSLHLGHKYLIHSAKEIAKKEGLKVNVMTFDPHPILFFNPEVKNINIISSQDKVSILEGLDINFLFLQKFNQELSEKSSKEFVEDLVSYLGVKHIVIGENFFFGVNKTGNVEFLQSYAKQLGFEVTVVPLLIPDSIHPISSSTIRDCLIRGKINEASKMLGYNYFISGEVIVGRKIGREMGFPTINLSLEGLLVPRFGVYTASIRIENDIKKYFGVVNLGPRPTFNEQEPLLEMHILDFNKDILGKNVKIMLHEHIRDQKKFASIKDLASQISKDKIKAQEYFSSLDA